MCCLLVKKKGVFIPKKYLKNAWRINPHGAGFASFREGKLLMRKGFMDFKSFYTTYRDFGDNDTILHFRWRSAGKISVENCHPFWVNPTMVVAHNGHINILTKDEESDTSTFNRQVLRRLLNDNKNFLDNPAIVYLISKSIGNSKLAFMDDEGKITIVNKGKGLDDSSGFWASNDDYKTYRNMPNRHTTVGGVSESGWY